MATTGLVLGLFALAKAVIKDSKAPEEQKTETTLVTDPGVWILQEDGQYQRHNMLPPGNCGEDAETPCYVQKNTTSSIPESFSASELDNYEFDSSSSSSGPYITTP
ncbi:hypothetical protein KXS00_24215 [Olivibacter jilunii]